MQGDPFVPVRNTKRKTNYRPRYPHSNNNYSHNTSNCSNNNYNRNSRRCRPHNSNFSNRGGPSSNAQPPSYNHHNNRHYQRETRGGPSASATAPSNSTPSYADPSQSYNGSQSFSNFCDTSNSNWHFADSSRAFNNKQLNRAHGNAQGRTSRAFNNLNNTTSQRRRSRAWADQQYSNIPFRTVRQPTTTHHNQQQPRFPNSGFRNRPQNPGFGKAQAEQTTQQSFDTAQSNGIESWARETMDTSEDTEDSPMADAHQMRHPEQEKKRKEEVEKAACDAMNPNAPLTYDGCGCADDSRL